MVLFESDFAKRPAGTPRTIFVSMNKLKYRDILIREVVPAIKSKWPYAEGEKIIQQDNATPHISPDDPEFVAAVSNCAVKISLRFQPPNSPHLKVLDLGFFTAIQCLQQTKPISTEEQLICEVVAAFEEMTPHKLNKVF